MIESKAQIERWIYEQKKLIINLAEKLRIERIILKDLRSDLKKAKK